MKINEIELLLVVRATNEATKEILVKQLKNQMAVKDLLVVMPEKESFELKLKRGFEIALEKMKPFSVFIDADILLKSNAIKKTKQTIVNLKEDSLGFGFRLWDFFYDQPKFRGFHVYRTSYLSKAIDFIPFGLKELRPESFVKKKMQAIGHQLENNLSFYVAGVHDYYQNANDIYYKYLIRAHRSNADLVNLKIHLEKRNHLPEINIALKAIDDAENIETIQNNKELYKNNSLPVLKCDKISNIDLLLISKLLRRYGLRRIFWQSI